MTPTIRVRRLVRIPLWLVLGAMLASLGTTRREELSTERRDARTRERAACGRTKACLKAPAALDRRLARDTADVISPTAFRARWTAAEYDEVAVWIAPGKGVSRWRPVNRYMVRDAFHTWTAAGAPVHFVFVADSAHADVRVLWRDTLPGTRAGQVTRLVDRRGWLRGATIEMSTRRSTGAARDSASVRAVALHEVGHLLGIEHSDDERDIMSAWVTARTLSQNDRTAMRLLYDIANSAPR